MNNMKVECGSLGYMTHVRNILRLDDCHRNVRIDKFDILDGYFLNFNNAYVKIEVRFIFGIDFQVEMTILFPQNSNDCIENISRLIISVQNDAVRNEIRSCTNYLQRKKDVNLAVSILKKISLAVGERKLILDTLLLQLQDHFKIIKLEDGGVLIICNARGQNYFKSHWIIQFDCSTHNIIDSVDFTVTRRNAPFYSTVKGTMDNLVQPYLPYNFKVEYWWCIIEALRAETDLPVFEIIESDSWNDKDFILVRSLTAVSEGVSEQYQIIESENEDCFIVKS